MQAWKEREKWIFSSYVIKLCHSIHSFHIFLRVMRVIFLDAESTDIEHYADKIPVLKGLTWTHFDGEAEREQGI